MPAYKYTLKNGKTKWYAAFNYTDWTGEKKHTCKRGFDTQREAKEYERNFLDQGIRSADIPFRNMVEKYIEDAGHRLKPTTMETKKNIIERWIVPYFSKLKVSEISAITIKKWQNMLIDRRDENGNPFSQTYLKSIHNQMSALMNYAVNHYDLPKNPCKTAGSIGSSHADEMNIWTQEEYERFSAQIKKSALKLAFDILFYTGMRNGEVLALTPADILPDMVISVNKNYARIKGEELFLYPKTSKSKRDITIPEFLYNDIQKYIDSLYGIQPGDRIFYFTKSALEHDIKRYAKAAGLEEIRLHDLRHSHASMLIHMGFNVLEISRRLGHKSVKTTLDTYGHLYPNQDKALASTLDKLRSSEE